MYIITILAILMIAQIIAYEVERKLADTLPMTVCGFILVLYGLAFFRVLSWIDYISIPVLIFGLVWILSNGLGKRFAQDIFSIQNICIALCMVLMAFSQLQRISVWWDDINFWSTDVKGLWISNGFAGKYGNVAPEFGDYPPAIQLFKWFFLHMSNTYIEGLGYAGYMCLNFIMTLPLISRLDTVISIKESIISEEDDDVDVDVARNRKYRKSNKRLVSKYKVKISGNSKEILGERILPLRCIALFAINFFACICLIVMPSVANSVCFEGSCMDVTMGLLYGILLWSIYDRDQQHKDFYFIRIALLGCVLVLCKSVGIEWAFYAACFLIFYSWYCRKNDKYNQASLFETNVRYGIYSVLSWGAIWISWMLFCLINRRVASLTSVGVNMVRSGNMYLAYFAKEKGLAYLQGLLLYPNHTDKTWLLDPPLGLIVVIFVILIFVMKKRKVIKESLAKFLMRFALLTAAAAYGFVFLCHLTVFSMETQYTTGDIMAVSISRYGAPWVLGTMILLIMVYIDSKISDIERLPVADSAVKEQVTVQYYKDTRMTFGIIAVLILLTMNYKAVYGGLIGYRDSLEADRQARAEMIDEEEKMFIEAVAGNEELAGKRVLYLKDAGNVRWVHDAYINYEVVPISVVYGAVSSESSKEDVDNTIASSHAKYIYVENIEDVDGTMGQVLDWQHTSEQGTIHLYRVLDDGRIEPYRETIDIE